MTFKGKNGKTYTRLEPGYTLDLTSGTPNIRPTTAADINSIMAALTNGDRRTWYRGRWRQHWWTAAG